MPIKPTVPYVKDILDEWHRAWSLVRTRDRLMRDHFYWRNVIPGPRNADFDVEIVRSGLIPDTANRMVGIFATSEASFEYIAANLSRKEQERNTDVEDWLKAALQQVQNEESRSLLVPFFLDLVLSGRAVWQVLADPYRYSQEEGYPVRTIIRDGVSVDIEDDAYLKMVKQYKYAARLPITWSHIPSDDVWYEIRPGKGLVEVLTRKVVRLADLEERYGRRKVAGFIRDNALVDRLTRVYTYEYWNEQSYLAVAGAISREGEDRVSNDTVDPGMLVLEKFDHEYGTPPFVIVEGSATGSRDIRDRVQPILADLFAVAETLDKFLSMKGTDTRMHTWRTFIFKTSEEHPAEADEKGRPRNMDVVTGKSIALWPDESFAPLLDKGPDPGTMQFLEMLLQLAAQNGLGNAVRGITTGMTSGYMQNSAYVAAAAKINALGEEIRKGYERLGQLFLKAVVVMDEKVPVFFSDTDLKKYLEIGPDDIKGYYRLRAYYEPKVPNDQIANTQIAALLKQNRLLNTDRIRQEVLGFSDPDKINDALLIEDFNDSPALKEFLLKKALERAGELEEAEQAEAQGRVLGNYQNLPPGLQRALSTTGTAPVPQAPQEPLPGGNAPGMANPNDMAMSGGMRGGPGPMTRAAGVQRQPGGPGNG